MEWCSRPPRKFGTSTTSSRPGWPNIGGQRLPSAPDCGSQSEDRQSRCQKLDHLVEGRYRPRSPKGKLSFRWRLTKQSTLSKNRPHGVPRPIGDSVIQRFKLKPPAGQLLADKNLSWWEQQKFSELTGFQVERDLEIVAYLEAQKAKLDQQLAEKSNTEP